MVHNPAGRRALLHRSSLNEALSMGVVAILWTAGRSFGVFHPVSPTAGLLRLRADHGTTVGDSAFFALFASQSLFCSIMNRRWRLLKSSDLDTENVGQVRRRHDISAVKAGWDIGRIGMQRREVSLRKRRPIDPRSFRRTRVLIMRILLFARGGVERPPTGTLWECEGSSGPFFSSPSSTIFSMQGSTVNLF